MVGLLLGRRVAAYAGDPGRRQRRAPPPWSPAPSPPRSLAACIAGHRSAEPGHVAALNKLGLRPLVDLDLRLGEGTGALLALPLVQSAARAMHEVATFDSAGVTEK